MPRIAHQQALLGSRVSEPSGSSTKPGVGVRLILCDVTAHYPLPTFFLSPLLVALPSIFGLTPLSTAFTHFNRGGGVSFLSSDVQTRGPSDLSTLLFSEPSPLFVTDNRASLFLFNNLRTLFANTGGYPPHCKLDSAFQGD